jgi:hypothetical protein
VRVARAGSLVSKNEYIIFQENKKYIIFFCESMHNIFLKIMVSTVQEYFFPKTTRSPTLFEKKNSILIPTVVIAWAGATPVKGVILRPDQPGPE